MKLDGRGGSAKSDFISKGEEIKHLMRGEGVEKGQKSSDVIYGQPLADIEERNLLTITVPFIIKCSLIQKYSLWGWLLSRAPFNGA